ncbi:NACHT domain-containing protein [Leptolyngbya sp. NIES-2104]|uniref:NACHT domain-containing protein n=1 Tax=Leptolyngbya sp. NIES-2104 TaxID=1552121 RepID=UPI0006EC9DF0|nr:NACHT domain-containing protein [Leptolyngbya sp. NIES-2104]GAP93649.1 hypothetical protein NIES2104_01560 [Leptolyngbya sp. NIES-2104]
MTRRYDNEGRDQINIENARDVYVAGARQRPDRELKWLKAFSDEVEGRLATSLHNQILINLGKEVQPDQVRRLWDMEVKTAQATEAIAPEAEILTVFDRKDIAGKLLILGKPGAGKTTTLLELAQALVKRAIDDPIAPMPFLLNLSSWKDPKQSIRDWAISELTTKGVGSKLSAKWFAEQKLLPLLDGLDEVRSDLQSECVKAINQWLGGEEQPRAMVLCSRREEYELYLEKLNLNGAIYLQELSNEQIENYLERVDRLALWQVLNTDVELLDLVRQPLLLSITLVAYRSELAEQWQISSSTQERLTFLLDGYVEQMLHRTIRTKFYREKQPSPRQTRQWLVKLAEQLQKDSRTEFLIEQIQPSWLGNRYRFWAYWLVSELSCGLTYGITFGLVGGLIELTSDGLTSDVINSSITGLYFGLMGGVSFGLIGKLNQIQTVEKIQLSFKRIVRKQFLDSLIGGVVVGVRRGLIIGISIGLIVGLGHGLFFVLSDRLIIGLIASLVAGLISGLVFGLIVGFIDGITGGLVEALKADIETRVQPNQGIWNSARNAVCVFVFLTFPMILFGSNRYSSLHFILSFNLFVVFASSMKVGGLACVQHFSLRFILFLTRAIPWNYARFLNYATERMFLQRIGGRYRFIHKLLQDHFARMEP